MKTWQFYILMFICSSCLNTGEDTNKQKMMFLGSSEEDIAHSLKIYEGDYYIVGTTRIDSKSPTDHYLIKMNRNGDIEKKITLGFPRHDVGSQVIVDDEGIFLFGSAFDRGFQNVDMHLVKMNNKGKPLWEKFYGTNYQDQGFNFIRTSDGGFALIGYSNSPEDFGDLYFVKINKDGDPEWEKFFGPKYVDYGFSLIENRSGEFLLAGTENGFYNPTQTDFLTHDADILIIKTDNNGEQIWYKTFGGDSHDWAKDIIEFPGEGYLVCGSTQSYGKGSFDIFLMKIDENGNELWMKTFGGHEFEYGEKLQQGADGNIYIAGSTASFSDNGNPDHYIIKTDTVGELIWSATPGTKGSDYSSGLAATPDSGAVFTGWSTEGEKGKTDIVFYKISKDGELQSLPGN
jgi:hypothetical protein